jgi:hypothetical protein
LVKNQEWDQLRKNMVLELKNLKRIEDKEDNSNER